MPGRRRSRLRLQTLAVLRRARRKIAFLGDMRELGTRAEDAHKELGLIIEALGGLDALYTVGDLAALIPNAARRFTDSEGAAKFAGEALELAAGDIILVKGSRAMAMEKIAAALEPTPARAPTLPKREGRELEQSGSFETLALPASGGEATGRGVGSC